MELRETPYDITPFNIIGVQHSSQTFGSIYFIPAIYFLCEKVMFTTRPAQGIEGLKANTLSELYSYTLNINNIYLAFGFFFFFFHLKSIFLEKKIQIKMNSFHYSMTIQLK